MGREDIDVRCMGRGRPFVIELKEPKLRSCNYQELENLINEQANEFNRSFGFEKFKSQRVVRIKDTPADKSYTIRFRLQPMNGLEYGVLTAPLDLTKEDSNPVSAVLNRATSARITKPHCQQKLSLKVLGSRR